jgi:membrane protein required for colicin V production
VNLLDWLLVLIVAASVLQAVIQGFVHEALMLAATMFGLALAIFEYQAVGAWVFRSVHTELLRNFLGFLTVFFLTIIAAALIAKLARGLIGAAGLRWFDRLLGAALGLVRGVLIGTVLLVMLAAFPVSTRMVRFSLLAPDFLSVGDTLVLAMGHTFREQFYSGRELIENARPAISGTMFKGQPISATGDSKKP